MHNAAEQRALDGTALSAAQHDRIGVDLVGETDDPRSRRIGLIDIADFRRNAAISEPLGGAAMGTAAGKRGNGKGKPTVVAYSPECEKLFVRYLRDSGPTVNVAATDESGTGLTATLRPGGRVGLLLADPGTYTVEAWPTNAPEDSGARNAIDVEGSPVTVEECPDG